MSREAHNVGNDAIHRWRWRVDESVSNHKLLENIILNGASQTGEDRFSFRGVLIGIALQEGTLTSQSLLLLNGSLNVKGHDWQNSTIHRHADRYPIERDPIEQYLHIFNGINRHSCHPNIAHDPWVVGIIPTVRRQIERHRQSLLPSRQILAIEFVGFFCR